MRILQCIVVLALSAFRLNVEAQKHPQSAPSDAAYLAVFPEAKPGTIYFNTTTKVDRGYDGAAFHDLWAVTPPAAVFPVLSPDPVSVVATGLNVMVAGPFWPNAPWKQAVTAPISSTLTAGLQPFLNGRYLHMDATIAYFVVDSRKTPLVPVTIVASGNDGNYASESDDVWVPVSPAAAAAVEQGSDGHLILYDVATQVWIEMYRFAGTAATGYTCTSKTIWDATYDWTQGNPRPFGYTSVDAAGLPLAPLLVKRDEYLNPTMVTFGGKQIPTLGHAMRITFNDLRTAGYSNGDGVWAMIPPASHSAPNLSGGAIAGMRLVLDPAYDTTSLTDLALVLANTAKTYGFIVADRGSTGMFTATADSNWTAADLDALKTIPAGSLQVVTPNSVYVPAMPQAVAADLTGLVKPFPVGQPPKIASFTWANGVLTWQTIGATYVYVDKLGLVRGASIAAPAGSYTLTASNPFGRASSVAQ